MQSKYYFASCQDVEGTIEYLTGATEQDIIDYCEKNHDMDLLHEKKAIMAWYTNPTPITVAHYFKWVSTGRDPFVISKPHDYKNPTKKAIVKW